MHRHTLPRCDTPSLLWAIGYTPSIVNMQAVEDHVESLRSWTYQQLCGLRHSNGVPLLKLFGAHAEGPEHQGGIFQFQVCVYCTAVTPFVLRDGREVAHLRPERKGTVVRTDELHVPEGQKDSRHNQHSGGIECFQGLKPSTHKGLRGCVVFDAGLSALCCFCVHRF